MLFGVPFFSQSAKINPFQGWAVNSVAPAVLMHCGSSGGDKMGDLLKTNQLNVTFIDPILSQSAVTDWVLRANAETCRRFVKMLLSYRDLFLKAHKTLPV